MTCTSRQRLLALLLGTSWLLGGCSVLQGFAPAVTINVLDASEAIELKRGDILTRGEISDATKQTLRVAALDAELCATPIATICLDALAKVTDVSTDQRLAALAELWLARAQATDPGEAQYAAWLESIRFSYAYLFFGDRTPGERAFEDRQTQIRDWYNYSVEQAVTTGFKLLHKRANPLPTKALREIGGWQIRTNLSSHHLPGNKTLPEELMPASSLAFSGLRSLYRRDGFGAELIAIMPNQSLNTAPTQTGRPKKRNGDRLPWSEMPAASLTALLHPDGDDLSAVLSTHSARLTIDDPYAKSTVQIHGQPVPLAANFTAGYGVWLARAGFNQQSLLSLLGRDGGIDRPHVYLMQPYDPKKRIIVMLHGLASSPEAWVELANEILGDDALRQHYQIWQVYYPTNLPIMLNHATIRKALSDTLAHFDPSNKAPASSNLVLVGHSMGGLIARLMISTSNESLENIAPEERKLTAQQIKSMSPMLRFKPFPNVSTAMFIATPHKGTAAAGSRLGRWIAGFIRLPITVLEGVAETIVPNVTASIRESLQLLPNSIDGLDEKDLFIQAAASFPISPKVRYHSIVARVDPTQPLAESDDGIVPYTSSHLPGAESEKIITSSHSVQQNANAILEIQRILREDITPSSERKSSR